MSGSGITEWRAKELIDTIAAHVEENMEAATKVVEVDARHRMLSIREPEFGTGYRRVLALYRLKSIVKREGMDVVGKVGIPPGEKGGSYGYYIEVGSRTAPAHPWLRPALLTNLQTIIKLLRG